MTVKQELLEIIACPKCKGDLIYVQGSSEGFGCKNCKLFYPIEDDIPNFLIEEAKPWEEEQPKPTQSE